MIEYFYTYGFHSHSNCDAFKRLKKGLDINPIELLYNNDGLFSDNINWLKNQILEHIKTKNIKEYAFIGNSLGAFYLSQIASLSLINNEFPKPKICYLFNPVRDPILQLKKYIGINHNITTNKNFHFTKEALESYREYINHSGNINDGIKRFIFIALQDELINARDSIKYWENSSKIITFEGKHKIEDFSIFRDYLNS